MFGHLGLPLITALSDMRTIRLEMATASVRDPALQAIQARIETDPRFKLISDKAFNRISGFTGVSASNILMWWIWRANEKGIDHANEELETYFDRERIEICVALWLYGPITDEIVKITDDISLYPAKSMPLSFERQSFMNPFKEPPETFFGNYDVCAPRQLGVGSIAKPHPRLPHCRSSMFQRFAQHAVPFSRLASLSRKADRQRLTA